MQTPELVALNGAVASPAHEGIRIRNAQLVGRVLNIDEALENVTTITKSGWIDLSSTVERASDYNSSLVWYADDAGVLAIASARMTKPDSVNADILEGLIVHWRFGDWEWRAQRDHDRHPGSQAARALHMIVRFGELVWSELYTICGRVQREKTCFYAVTRLRRDDFLIRRKQGRPVYFGLGPVVRDNIPISGDRDRRDPVAFEAAMAAGRALIASRRRTIVVPLPTRQTIALQYT
jgi:hypothetical protein